MRTPYLRSISIVGLAALGLVACGEKSETEAPAQEAEQVAEEAASETGDMMEKAKDVAKDMAEEAADMVAAAVTLDTSSVDAFTASLASMKAQLSDADAGRMTEALGKLAAKAVSDNKEGLMDAAKSMASGKSSEEGIFDMFGDQLSGLDFEGLMAFAG